MRSESIHFQQNWECLGGVLNSNQQEWWRIDTISYIFKKLWRTGKFMFMFLVFGDEKFWHGFSNSENDCCCCGTRKLLLVLDDRQTAGRKVSTFESAVSTCSNWCSRLWSSVDWSWNSVPNYVKGFGFQHQYSSIICKTLDQGDMTRSSQHFLVIIILIELTVMLNSMVVPVANCGQIFICTNKWFVRTQFFSKSTYFPTCIDEDVNPPFIS